MRVSRKRVPFCSLSRILKKSSGPTVISWVLIFNCPAATGGSEDGNQKSGALYIKTTTIDLKTETITIDRVRNLTRQHSWTSRRS